MLVTELVAKHMRCPQPFHPMPHSNVVSFNCTGTQCMAWRFSAGDFVENTFPPIKLGYCGLAGKP